MLGAKPHVYDADETNFQQRVIDRSAQVPVVVDFWAEWCGPCKTLGPALEALAAEFAGRFELVKVDIDKNPRLAQAFRVQSIPLVYAFKDGQPIDGFQGAVPPAQLRQFIEKLAPPPQKSPLEIGAAALAAGDLTRAQRAYEKALAEKPENAGEANLGLARVGLARREPITAALHLDKITDDDPAFAQAERLRGVLAFGADAGDESELMKRIAGQTGDVEAWFMLGATLATAQRFEEAMAAFLKVVELDRAFREDAGRMALLSLFDLLGAADERVIRYRRSLARTLF